MFSYLAPKDNAELSFSFEEYVKRHFLKSFEKKYSKRQWSLTLLSIKQDLSRIRMKLNDLRQTQQVDELWHNVNYWIFKYDFRVAQTKESAKASGNRCICFLDIDNNAIGILLIYSKGDLPKNTGEQSYTEKIVRT